jgi:antitoxin component of RelBE/YafQ-DinJ toxin-antitoxin module
VKFSKNLVSVFEFKKVVPVRLDGETINAVKRVAKQKGVGTSTAVRMLIRERLSELKVI